MTNLVILNLVDMTARRVSDRKIEPAFKINPEATIDQLKQDIEMLRVHGEATEEATDPSHLAFDAMAATLTA